MSDRRTIDQPPPTGADGQLVYERILPSVTSSIGAVRHGLDETLGRIGFAQWREDVVLVASEAVANVVLHAYPEAEPGPLYAAAKLGRRALTLGVCDAGHGIRARVNSPGASLGLALMSQLCDELTIRHPPGESGTQICATFRLPGVATPAPAVRYGPSCSASDDTGALADYVRALLATSLALQADTRSLIAQADQHLRRGRQLRRTWLRTVT